MHSKLGMVAARSKLLRSFKACRKIVGCAAGVVAKILSTYFSIFYEVEQADFCVFKLQSYPKKRFTDKRQDLPTELFQGRDTFHALFVNGPELTRRKLIGHDTVQ